MHKNTYKFLFSALTWQLQTNKGYEKKPNFRDNVVSTIAQLRHKALHTFAAENRRGRTIFGRKNNAGLFRNTPSTDNNEWLPF